MSFKSLHARLALTESTHPKDLAGRVHKLEVEMIELRHALRHLIEILEETLQKDLDDDGKVGHSEAKHGLPKTARLLPNAVTPRLPVAPVLPPSIP
jgi:hypothetical protein